MAEAGQDLTGEVIEVFPEQVLDCRLEQPRAATKLTERHQSILSDLVERHNAPFVC